MCELNCQVLKTTNCNLDEFIGFWSKRYNYDDFGEFIKRVKKRRYTIKDLEWLFEWKNGMKLSGKKEESLRKKIIPRKEKINRFKSHKKFNIDAYLKEFKDVSFVWKIFLLHIIKPDEYPIYDQNVHRAYNCIMGKKYHFIKSSMSEKEKHNFYFDEYALFIKMKKIKSLREFDKAMFAFGQFLNRGNYNEFFENNGNE